VQSGDTVTIDLEAKSLELAVPDEVLAARNNNFERGDPSGKAYIAAAGYAQKYVACVGPANCGAVTHAGAVHWPNEAVSEDPED
jgi:dihydroxy-acid dehydratase